MRTHIYIYTYIYILLFILNWSIYISNFVCLSLQSLYTWLRYILVLRFEPFPNHWNFNALHLKFLLGGDGELCLVNGLMELYFILDPHPLFPFFPSAFLLSWELPSILSILWPHVLEQGEYINSYFMCVS